MGALEDKDSNGALCSFTLFPYILLFKLSVGGSVATEESLKLVLSDASVAMDSELFCILQRHKAVQIRAAIAGALTASLTF